MRHQGAICHVVPSSAAIHTSNRLLKNYFCTLEIRLGLGHRRDRRTPQGVQKGHLLTRPPQARRDAPLPRGRPQRAKRRIGTYQASLEPLASIMCERRGTLPLALPYGEPLSDARTPLADFFNALLKRRGRKATTSPCLRTWENLLAGHPVLIADKIVQLVVGTGLVFLPIEETGGAP